RLTGKQRNFTSSNRFLTLRQGLVDLRQTIPANFILRICGNRLLGVDQGLFCLLLLHEYGRQSQVCLGKTRIILERLLEVLLGFVCVSCSAVQFTKFIGSVGVAWE